MARLDQGMITFDDEEVVGVAVSGGNKTGRPAMTHEEFVKKVNDNPNNNSVVLLSEYIDARTKVRCRCLDCDAEWDTNPRTLYKGMGCQQCYVPRLLTRDEVIQRVAEKHKSIIVVGDYINSKTELKFKCITCGYEWNSLLSTVVNGNGCLKCNGHRRRTGEEFIYELSQINKTVEVTGEYVNTNTKITCRCRECSFSWESTPARLLDGKACPRCGKLRFAMSRKKTHEQFVEEVRRVNENIKILGYYKGSAKHILCHCNVCGNNWNGIAGSLLQNEGCPQCAKIRRADLQRKSQQQFIDELKRVNENIEIVGQYINSETKIDCRCVKCATIWSATPNNLISRRSGCPWCAKSQTSFLERVILFALRDIIGEENVLSRDKTIIGKELDIYIPSMRAAIEPGSYFWHKSKVANDKEKHKLCNQQGVRLMTIYDKFYDNKDHLELGDNFLTYECDLNILNNRHVLRDCLIKVFSWLNLDYAFSNDEEQKLFLRAKISSTRKTIDDVAKELHDAYPNIKISGDYCGCDTAMQCYCEICGHKWKSIINTVKQKGCPRCNRFKKVVNLNTGEIFRNAESAAQRCGLTTHFIRCVSHDQKMAGGYYWAYLKDLTPDQLATLRAKFPDTFKY